ncbi:MAG: VacJ family lipoprotein [Rhodospirillales bacterium]
MTQHFHRIFAIGVLSMVMTIGGAVDSSAAEWGPPDSEESAPVEMALAQVALARIELAQAKPKPEPENDVNDPLESMNRGIFAFNEFFLRWVLGPISGVYKDFVPDPVRQSVGNILHLVASPIILANDLLQGEWKRAWITTQRTVVNATVGVGGTFDVAETFGLPRHNEDLGQTLAVWGVGEGFYLVIPFFGPSNPRDAVGKLVDGYFHPLTRWADNTNREEITYGLFSASAVHEYSEIKDELDQIRKTSIDYYAAIRSMFRQKRAAEIRNGAEVDLPPIPDLGFDIDVDEIDKPSAGAGDKPATGSGELSAN